MQFKKSHLIPEIQLVGDLILLNLAFLIVNYFNSNNVVNAANDRHLVQFLYLNLFWIGATTILKTYNHYRVMRVGTILNMLVKTCIFHIFLIFSFIVILKQELDSVKLFIFKYSLFFIFILFWRVFFIYFLKYIRVQGYNYKRIVIAGAGKVGKDISKFFDKHPEYGYKCLGFFDDNEKHKNRIGSLDELEFFALNNNVDEIYCALPDVEHDKVQQLMSFADNNLLRLKILPDLKSIGNQKFEITFYDNIPVLTFRKDPLDSIVNRFFKRSFDIVFSLVVILSIFPWLFPIIAISIKLSSKGPVFFKQQRSGRGNKPFACYKFRTMRPNSMANHLQAIKNDNRITSIGQFLRNTSLDELPQFFNVFIGNMSIVGPRPHMLYHTEKYSKEIDKFMLRHFVKAGITGLAQVKGCRGETSNNSQMDERVQWDLWYIENWSFYFDLQIIYFTITEMFRGRIKGA